MTSQPPRRTGDATASEAPAGWIGFFRSGIGRLALGLLVIEFLAAMQVFTTATILPTVGDDLDGRSLYGAAIAATLASALLTMPVGGTLMARHGVSRLLTWLAPLYGLGAVVSSLAPSMPVFVAGRVLQGLAAGALSTVALGAIAAAIPEQWRPRIFALTSAMWILPALFGPSYAVLVVEWLSWRWALLLLVPPLLLARLAVARQIGRVEVEPSGGDRRLRLGAAAVVAAAVTLITFGSSGDGLGLVVAVAGVAVALAAARRILPHGVLAARPGRPAALLALLLLSVAYFGANSVVAIVISEGLAGSIRTAGATLSAGALGWAGASIVHEAVARRLRLSATGMVRLGSAFLVAGFLAFAVLVNAEGGWALALVPPAAWAGGGIGMGLAYPVLLHRILQEQDDGIDPGFAASSTVLSEALGSAFGSAIAGAAVSAWAAATTVDAAPVTALFAGLAAVAFVLAAVAPRLHSR